MQVDIKEQGLKGEYTDLEANIRQKLKFSEWAEQETIKVNLEAWESGGLGLVYVGSIAGLIKRLG